MLSFFKKFTKNKDLEKSLDKYLDTLDNDRGLMLCIKQGEGRHNIYIDTLTRDEIVFIVPIGNRVINRYKPDAVLNVDFLSRTGVYMTKIKITKRDVRENQVYYTGEFAAEIERNQRRNNARLNYEMDIAVLVGDTFDAKTVNISSGGMLIASETEFFDNQEIMLVFDIDDKIYRLKSQVVKARPYAQGRQHYYHIKFLNITPVESDRIAKFVFDTEMNILAKEAGVIE